MNTSCAFSNTWFNFSNFPFTNQEKPDAYQSNSIDHLYKQLNKVRKNDGVPHLLLQFKKQGSFLILEHKSGQKPLGSDYQHTNKTSTPFSPAFNKKNVRIRTFPSQRCLIFNKFEKLN